MVSNLQVRLRARPSGLPRESDFLVSPAPVPQPEPGQFLVALRYVSVDPAMRTWISGEPTYRAPVNAADLIPAQGVGRVIASAHPGFAVGMHVRGMFGVQAFALSDGAGVTPVDPARAPLASYLGVLGVSGLSAYFGLLRTARIRPGETVLVSGAAGAVGSLAGQIAKIHGCRVVGIAGGADKCAYLVEQLGFDAALDHRDPAMADALGRLCPTGVDAFFDNVGGPVLEAALAHLATGARIVVCGAVSQYNTSERRGPSNYLNLLLQRATMTGFLVFDHTAEFPAALAALAQWQTEGRLRGDVHVLDGLDAFPRALRGLFEGINLGKLVLAVGPAEPQPS